MFPGIIETPGSEYPLGEPEWSNAMWKNYMAWKGGDEHWKRIEDIHLSPLRSVQTRYALYDGKFTRTLALPQDRDYTSDEIAKGISEYIKLFDHLMKGYLAGRYTPNEVEAIYMTQVRGGQIIV